MASLPPTRTREEAEQDAEFIRGALMEAGRPDLAGRIEVGCQDRGGYGVFWGYGPVDDDDRAFIKANSLLYPAFPCFDCWAAHVYSVDLAEQILLDCDHVLVAPRGVA